MKKVIFLLFTIGLLLNLSACQDSHEMAATDSAISEPSISDNAVSSLIMALDSLNCRYQTIARGNNNGSGIETEEEEPPKDSLDVVPPWVDETGGMVWNAIGSAGGIVAGTSLGGGNPISGAVIGSILGAIMKEVGAAYTSAMVQLVMNCMGLAFVTPNYSGPSQHDLPLYGFDDPDNPDYLRYKSFTDSLGYRHNAILAQLRDTAIVGSEISDDVYYDVFQLCIDKYNGMILQYDMQLQVSDSYRDFMVQFSKEINAELASTIENNKTYSEFVDATCDVVADKLQATSDEIRIIRDFSSVVLQQYYMLDDDARQEYAADVAELISESDLSEEEQESLLIDCTIGFSSVSYWTAE